MGLQRSLGRTPRQGYGVPNGRIADAFQARGDVPDLSGAQLVDLGSSRAEEPELQRLAVGAGRQHSHALSCQHLAVENPHVGHETLVGVVLRVEDQRPHRV